MKMHLLVFAVMVLSCKKSSNDQCSLSNAQVYEQGNWVYDIHSCNSAVATIYAADVPSCEYWIVDFENVNTDGRAVGLALSGTSATQTTTISGATLNTWSVKITTGHFAIVEANTNGCPYNYHDKYRITKYK